MTIEEIFESLENVWSALSQMYNESPDEVTRVSMNNLGRIIDHVETHAMDEFAENNKEEISIEDWLSFFAQ